MSELSELFNILVDLFAPILFVAVFVGLVILLSFRRNDPEKPPGRNDYER